jgi:TrmH family RNA methyltransferase
MGKNIFKHYKKNLDYSYTLGVFPTLELLESKPEIVKAIYLKSDSEKNKGIKTIKSICKDKNIQIDINDKLINKLTQKENVFSIGVFCKYKTKLEENINHVVLVNPSDTGNLGTIIRTMIGFNIKNLGIVSPGVDIFNPKAIRASMGSIFRINFEYFNNIVEYRNKYKNSIYTFLTNGKQLLPEVEFNSPFSLIFGPEGAGLPTPFQRLGTSIKIPQSNNIDSYNLAISVGIALYEATN